MGRGRRKKQMSRVEWLPGVYSCWPSGYFGSPMCGLLVHYTYRAVLSSSEVGGEVS